MTSFEAAAERSVFAAGCGAVKSGQSCAHFVPSAGSASVNRYASTALSAHSELYPSAGIPVVRGVTVAGHRQQPRVAELLHEPLGLLVRRRRVVPGADDERRRVAPRRPERAVELVLRPDRIQPPVELGVAVVPERVVVVLVRALARLEERRDATRVVLLVRAEQEVLVRAGRVAPVVVAAEEPVGDRADPGAVAGLELHERVAELVPRVDRVDLLRQGGPDVVARHGPVRRVGRRDRRRVRLLDQVVDGPLHVTAAERARSWWRRARDHEAADRALEARGLLVQAVERVVHVLVGIERAVEHDRAGLAREQALDRGARGTCRTRTRGTSSSCRRPPRGPR